MVSPWQKFWAAISYLGPFVFIPLFFKMKGDFVSFHNRQGLALFFGQAFFSLFSSSVLFAFSSSLNSLTIFINIYF